MQSGRAATGAPKGFPGSAGILPARTREIGRRGPQADRIVAEQPEPGVAVVAKEPPHLFRHGTMIDAQRAAPRRPPADGADALLRLEQPPVLLLAQPIDALDAR